MKKVRTLSLVVGIILLFLSLSVSAMSAYNAHFDPYSIGLGGVDLLTALLTFFDRLFDRYLLITATGFVLTAVSVVWLIIDKVHSKRK